MIRDENLDFWIQHNYNVLFIGAHGVGKTSIVRDAFNRNKLKWKYFSAATMDPWVDLVGVPRERQDEHGEPYLDLLRCQGLDEIEALFLDEYNRAHKKVRNAVMELIQFRTINGKPFKKLKLIWAAINPDDDDSYDVEKLDPAQADRFHAKVTVPYKPEKEYFMARYGSDMARAAISWWNEMPKDVQQQVSPRRLDYALDIYTKNGDIRFALPDQCNVAKLLTTIRHGPIEDALHKLVADKDTVAAAAFLGVENNYQAAIGYIKKTKLMMEFFFPVLPAEKLSVLASEHKPLQFLLDSISDQEAYRVCIRDIYRAATDKAAVREIKRAARKSSDVAAALGLGRRGLNTGNYQFGTKIEQPYFSKQIVTPEYYRKRIRELASFVRVAPNTQDRRNMYNTVVALIPKSLPVNDTLDTLVFLDGLAEHSRFTTVQALPHFMGIVNHCFRQIGNELKYSQERVVKTYSDHKFPKLWNTIVSDRTLSAKLIPFLSPGGNP